MATSSKNLSAYDKSEIVNGENYKVGIAVSEWNDEITGKLLKGALETFLKHKVKQENIHVQYCPGSYELPLTSQFFLDSKEVDGVLAIGSVIKGETPHFDFVCEAVSQGIKDVGLKYNKPVIFCVLTDNTLQQAKDRSGGKHGNKGIECAVALMKMITIRKKFYR